MVFIYFVIIFSLSFLCQGCTVLLFFIFFMVSLCGYLPLFCYSYLNEMSFPKPPIGRFWSGERRNRTLGARWFPRFLCSRPLSSVVLMDSFFKIQLHFLCLLVIYIYMRCELPAIRSLLVSATKGYNSCLLNCLFQMLTEFVKGIQEFFVVFCEFFCKFEIMDEKCMPHF